MLFPLYPTNTAPLSCEKRWKARFNENNTPSIQLLPGLTNVSQDFDNIPQANHFCLI